MALLFPALSYREIIMPSYNFTDRTVMGDVKSCTKCKQKLNVPSHIGGMLMECPSCGHRFHSDFKIAGTDGQSGPNSSTKSEKKPVARSGFSVVV